MASKKLQGMSVSKGVSNQAAVEGRHWLKEGDMEDWLSAMFTPILLLGIILLLSC